MAQLGFSEASDCVSGKNMWKKAVLSLWSDYGYSCMVSRFSSGNGLLPFVQEDETEHAAGTALASDIYRGTHDFAIVWMVL
ncbi:hypothetical protein ARSEF4850_008230 [Beauveria asiatica]